jgi:hypothetical protein
MIYSALKFAVDHPLTDYYQVPAKGSLPSWSYIQPNTAYKHRKVVKYDPAAAPSSQYPPMTISSNPKTVSKRQQLSTYTKSDSLQTTGKASLSRSLPGRRMTAGKERAKHVHHELYEQLDEVLTDLNQNTEEIAMKPPGHGQNLKENILALKRFVRPQTGLQGLASMVGQVLEEFESS